MEGTLRIVKDDLFSLEEHEHVRVLVLLALHKLQCHRNQISVWPIQMWPQVDLRL